jgi:hypothetical protein
MSLLASILLVSSPTASVPVDVGRFDPAAFPNLHVMERQMPHAEMTNRAEKIFADGKCHIEGQNKRRFDVTVRYAVLMGSDGRPQRIVVGDVGCAPLETLVGQVVLAQANRGDFRLAHQEGERWYSSELNFSAGEPVKPSMIADRDKVICTREEPKVGSRVAKGKVCKTAAEWQAAASDRQQLHRDIQNAAMGPPTTQ